MSFDELITQMSLDDLIAAVQHVAARRFPDLEWASLVFHRPEVPNTVLVIRPRPISESPFAALPPGPE